MGISIEAAFLAPFRPGNGQKQMIVVAWSPVVVVEEGDVQDLRVTAVIRPVVPIERKYDVVL